MEKVFAFAIGCAVVVTIIDLWTLLQALFLMWAWNLVIPMLFHAPSLTYGAALAISALLSIVAGFFRSTFRACEIVEELRTIMALASTP